MQKQMNKLIILNSFKNKKTWNKKNLQQIENLKWNKKMEIEKHLSTSHKRSGLYD
jgi:hypothetical protein